MKKLFVLVKKEIKELVTIQMILPLLIMVLIFSMVGNVISKETAKMKEPQAIWVVDADKSEISAEAIKILEKGNLKASVFTDEDLDAIIKKARESRIASLLVIPAGFGEGIKNFEPQKIEGYSILNNFSLTSAIKGQSVNLAISVMNNYFSSQWIEKNNISIPPEKFKNPVSQNEFVVIKDQKANISAGQAMGFIQKQTTFIPIILFMVIVIAAQMVAMAVASEKENKTFETLLSSPVSRKAIVSAKLIGAGVVAVLFAGVYMIGFNYYIKGVTSMGASTSSNEALMKVLESLGIVISPAGYVLLGISLFLGILVALAVAMILGAFVESVKSVQAVTTPLMVLVLVPYLLVMFLDIDSLSPILKYLIYAIPFVHPFLAAQKMMTQDYLFIVYGIIYQSVVFLAFVILAAKIFSSDKILTLRLNFSKKKK